MVFKTMVSMILASVLIGLFLAHWDTSGEKTPRLKSGASRGSMLRENPSPLLNTSQRIRKKISNMQLGAAAAENGGSESNATELATQESWVHWSGQIVLINKLVAQSHNLFQQAFNAVLDRKPIHLHSVDSPFKEILWRIRARYDADGVPLSLAECRAGDYQFVFAGNPGAAAKEVNFVKCEDGGGSRLVAKFEFMSADRINTQLVKAELPRGFGVFLASLVTDSTKVLKSCRMQHKDEILTELDCPGLGQNADRETFVEFEAFHFQKAGPKVLVVKGSRRKNFDEVKEKQTLDVPLIGDIKVAIEAFPETQQETNRAIALPAVALPGSEPNQSQGQDSNPNMPAAPLPAGWVNNGVLPEAPASTNTGHGELAGDLAQDAMPPAAAQHPELAAQVKQSDLGIETLPAQPPEALHYQTENAPFQPPTLPNQSGVQSPESDTVANPLESLPTQAEAPSDSR